MGKTSIEWTDSSWNPIVGCTEISPGCANCYAARLAATRLRNTPQYNGLAEIHEGRYVSEDQPDVNCSHWTHEVRFLPERLEEPLHWKNPQRIFVCDMGDLFHESVKDEWIDQIYAVMVDCEHTHTFQVLTKRSRRMKEYFCNLSADRVRKHLRGHGTLAWPLRNIWLGVSVENQHFADERIPLLLETPAAVRWISAEPLLGPVNLQAVQENENFRRDAISGIRSIHPCLDWVVCGGESGPNARPMHPDWARSLLEQCKSGRVPFFFKQWGEWVPGSGNGFTQWPKCDRRRPLLMPAHPGREGVDQHQIMLCVGKKRAGRLLDGREWNEFPCTR